MQTQIALCQLFHNIALHLHLETQNNKSILHAELPSSKTPKELMKWAHIPALKHVR